MTIKGTTHSIDVQRAEWTERFPVQLRLDPDSATDLLLVEHFGEILAAIPPHELVPPVSEGTRRLLAGAIENFHRWCVLEEFVNSADAVKGLSILVLRRAVEQWLDWRLVEIAADHPLAGGRFGCRSTAPVRDLEPLRKALRWWARVEGLGDILSNKARLASAPLTPVRPARSPSDSELGAMVAALLSEEVVTAVTPTIRSAWHARQLAALNIAVATSLRPSAEFQLIRDENVLSVSDEVLRLRLPRTKLHPEGRIVVLHRRDDALCPMEALTRFLRICETAGWNRGGFLLPAVNRTRYQPLATPRLQAAAREPFRVITDHLGITDDLDTELRATPHGLRAMTPTRALANGVDVRTVQEHTGHATLKQLLVYDRAVGAPDDFVEAMAADLGATGAD